MSNCEMDLFGVHLRYASVDSVLGVIKGGAISYEYADTKPVLSVTMEPSRFIIQAHQVHQRVY